MYVNHSGYTEAYGTFSYDVYIDENKQDYELIFKDGSVAKQCGPFQTFKCDWNNDGDVYEQFGAFFEIPGDRVVGFWTPEDMVRAAVDAQDKHRYFFSNEVIAVKGIDLPAPEHRPKVDDILRQCERRAMHREIERNSKMNALGIRPPDEPWIR